MAIVSASRFIHGDGLDSRRELLNDSLPSKAALLGGGRGEADRQSCCLEGCHPRWKTRTGSPGLAKSFHPDPKTLPPLRIKPLALLPRPSFNPLTPNATFFTLRCSSLRS
jgi:hypothetical protein